MLCSTFDLHLAIISHEKQFLVFLRVVVYTGFTVLLLYMLQQEKLEKERMKQVVLGIHERQEEEDYQGN